MNKKIIKRLRPGASSYNFLNKFSVNFELSDPPVGLTASKSDKNLKENLSSHGASQKILNKILQDFERSDPTTVMLYRARTKFKVIIK